MEFYLVMPACFWQASQVPARNKRIFQNRIEVAIPRETKNLCPNHLPYARRDASPSLLFASVEGAQHDKMEKGKRTKSKGLGDVLGKTKTPEVVPGVCGEPAPA